MREKLECKTIMIWLFAPCIDCFNCCKKMFTCSKRKVFPKEEELDRAEAKLNNSLDVVRILKVLRKSTIVNSSMLSKEANALTYFQKRNHVFVDGGKKSKVCQKDENTTDKEDKDDSLSEFYERGSDKDDKAE